MTFYGTTRIYQNTLLDLPKGVLGGLKRFGGMGRVSTRPVFASFPKASGRPDELMGSELIG